MVEEIPDRMYLKPTKPEAELHTHRIEFIQQDISNYE